MVSRIYEPSTVSMVLQQITLHLQMREIEPCGHQRQMDPNEGLAFVVFFQRKLIERELFTMISWVEELFSQDFCPLACMECGSATCLNSE